MKSVAIGQALSAGWQQFTRRPWYLLGVTLATLALFILTASADSAVTALSYIVYGGFVALLLKHFAGDHVMFDDLFDLVDKRWIYFAFLGIVKGILIFLGFLCFVIPGVYLAVRWMFAELLVVDKGLRPMEALRASSEMTKGVWWKLFLYTIVVGLLVVLGAFVFLIGAVVAAVVAQLATIAIYRNLDRPIAEVVPEEEQHHEHHDHHHHDEHHHEHHG